MAGFKATIEVSGLERARTIARQVRNLGEDTTPLLEIAGGVLLASVTRRFDEQKGPGGIPWPISRRAQRQGGKTLTDTGDLRDSFRYAVRPDEVEIGSDGLKNPVKAVANQYGSHRQSVVLPHSRVINSAFGVPLPSPVTVNVRAHGRMTNLPARPMVGVDEEDRRDVEEAWRDHLIGLFGNAI